MSEYIPIPVLAAKSLAETYQRDIVIISAWSREHKLLHTVTYGVSAADKVSAANGGEICAKALGMDLSRSQFNEDFRKEYNAGRERAMLEAIRKHLPSLKTMARQIIHPTENTFSRMVKDLEKATL